MKIIKNMVNFGTFHRKTYTEGHQTHLKDYKIPLAIAFIISFVYTIIDDFIYLGTSNDNKVSYLGFMFGIIFQFIKLILMCFYLKRGVNLTPKRFSALERPLIVIFAASAIANWNIQLSIDPSRAFAVGLEAGWLFLYVHTLFHQWPWKAAFYVSVSLFGVYRMALSSQTSDMGCVQASLQIILVLITAYVEEKRKRESIIENISLEKSEQTFWNILNSLPDNIAILNLDGDLRFYNDYFDISFKVSQSEEGMDVFSQIYQVKPRERHLNLKKIQDRHNNAKPLPRAKTLKPTEKLKRQGTLSKGGQDHPLIRYLTQELEFTNKKGTSVLGKGKKEKKMRNDSRFSDHAPEKTLTEFFNSVNHFRDLQEVLDFFYGNVDLVRTYTERENNFFIFDGKYNTSEGLVKSYEIKILLSSLEQEENFVVILRDTTHRDIIVTLEDNNSFKDGVLSSISHELRTPLNTNLNLIELAINALNKFNKKNAIAQSPGGGNVDFPFSPETAINDIKEVYLVPAHKSGKLLESLINDILDYSMLVARKFVSTSKEKYLMKSLDKIRYLCEFQARKKNLEFHISLSQELNYKIKTDHKRLRQVLTNLMNNAIKFTTKGFVSLRIEPHPDNPSFIEFTVKDSGIGIAEANLERMTNVLEGGDFINKVNKEASGIGLGLIISHRLAKELGPRAQRISGIKVDSTLGEGSRFSFIIENWTKSAETLVARVSGSPSLRPVKSANMPHVSITPTNASTRRTRGMPITAYHTNPTLDIPLTTIPLETLADKDALITKDLEIEDEIACMIKDDNLKMNVSETKLLKRHNQNKSSFSGNVVSGLLLNSSDPYSGVIGDVKAQDELIIRSNRSSMMLDQKLEVKIPIEPRDKPEKGCICSEILVVDDDMFNLFTMENLLATLKFRITKATNGEEAIKVVLRRNELKCSSRCQTFKLIFMDLSMPVMDGFEATLKLRAMMKSHEISEIPIVACTAFVDQDKTEKCYECGMEGRISKPVNKNKLKEILKRYEIIKDNES